MTCARAQNACEEMNAVPSACLRLPRERLLIISRANRERELGRELLQRSAFFRPIPSFGRQWAGGEADRTNGTIEGEGASIGAISIRSQSPRPARPPLNARVTPPPGRRRGPSALPGPYPPTAPRAQFYATRFDSFTMKRRGACVARGAAGTCERRRIYESRCTEATASAAAVTLWSHGAHTRHGRHTAVTQRSRGGHTAVLIRNGHTAFIRSDACDGEGGEGDEGS